MYNFPSRVIVKSEGRRNSSQGYLYSAAASGLTVVLEPPPTICVSFLSLRSRHTALYGGHLFPESSESAPEIRWERAGSVPASWTTSCKSPSWEAVPVSSQQNGEVEQWQLAGLITRRSQVRVLPSQPDVDTSCVSTPFPVAAIDTGILIDKRGARAIARAEAYKEEP